MLTNFARLFLGLGVVFLVVGGLLFLAARLNLPLGRLPGDIVIRREQFTCLFPIVTSILLSILLTVVLNLIARIWK